MTDANANANRLIPAPHSAEASRLARVWGAAYGVRVGRGLTALLAGRCEVVAVFAAKGAVESAWITVTGSKGDLYTCEVSLAPGGGLSTCHCADFSHRGVRCYHLWAVALGVKSRILILTLGVSK